MSEQNVRKKILEINKMEISQSEKSKLIFEIMNKRFNITETKKKENIFCPHYNKYTYLVSKCCNKIYPCRNCHDANEDHKLNRHDIDFMKCDFCKCLQKVSDKCINPDCNYNKKKVPTGTRTQFFKLRVRKVIQIYNRKLVQ